MLDGIFFIGIIFLEVYIQVHIYVIMQVEQKVVSTKISRLTDAFEHN